LRERISRGCYVNPKPDDSLGRVLNAYQLANETKEMRDRLHQAIAKRDPDELDGIALLMGHERKELVDWACEHNIITKDESGKLLEALSALYDVLRVDAFDAAGIKKLATAAKGKRKVVERPVSD
jgi:acyl-CoA dehydrogenase